jgi:hypothetical protein
MEVSNELHASATLLSGGWVGPTAGLDVVEKRKTPNPIMTETLAPAVHFTE